MLPLGPSSLELNGVAALMGMSLFFCLSGFLITTILHKNPAVFPFVVKRVFRIFPAVALYLLILLLFFGLPFYSWLLNMLFVSNYVHDGLRVGPVGHLWSLCVEMHFYLAISIVVLVMGKRGLWLIPVAAVIITGLRIDAGATSNIKTHLRVDEILAGGCLALASIHYGSSLRRFFGDNRVAFMALVATAGFWFASSYTAFGNAQMYFRPYAAAMMVGVVIHSDLGRLSRILEGKVARYIADTSYALYIYHPLTIFGFMNSGSAMEKYLLRRPVSFVLTFVLAHLSTYLWEKPWQAFARRIISARAEVKNEPNQPSS